MIQANRRGAERPAQIKEIFGDTVHVRHTEQTHQI
jgi:hypothetical protein